MHKVQILKSKVELKLKKASTGISWNKLEGEPESLTRMSNTVAGAKPPSYPSSSKKAVDWSAVEKNVEEEKPEGEQALNALFQKIYADGSDEVRRAMMKSFAESGGTHLSTNWDDVKKETVTVKAPEGMEARKWDT